MQESIHTNNSNFKDKAQERIAERIFYCRPIYGLNTMYKINNYADMVVFDQKRTLPFSADSLFDHNLYDFIKTK